MAKEHGQKYKSILVLQILLKYTDKSISSISVYLGFSSQSHFNHAFKKITNKTPIEYRKKHTK